MRSLAISAALAAAILTTGCGVPLSVNRLYTDKDVVTDVALEGKWTDEKAEDVWQFRKENNGFVVTELGKPESELMIVHVVRIGEQRFLDVASKNTPSLAIDGHFFLKMKLDGEELLLQSFDWDWLKDKAAKAGLTEVVTDQKQRILTAPTADLQKFIALYAEDPQAFSKDVGRLHRVH